MTKVWTSDRLLGLCFLLLAVLIVAVWVPLDTGTGIAEKVRRRWVIGDALAPTLAGCVIAIGAVLTMLRPQADAPTVTPVHLAWVLRLVLLFGLALALMRYLGPLALSGSEGGYRPLRNTLPWKYLGYITGGTCLIAGLNLLVRGRLRARDLAVAILASLLIALAYDLPFEDLLLPPNGDV